MTDRSRCSEDPQALRVRALAAARAAGADVAGVTSADPAAAARDAMQVAFARGDYATWPYDEPYAEAATTPQSLLPNARSIVCFARRFATVAPGPRAPLSGRVSNYAWGTDYHGVMRRIGRAVAAELDAAAGVPATRVVCDTAPLSERTFARRAGLGWVGKHANLIAPGLGSFVFLGEVLTTLELPVDVPLRKSCGSCTRCLVACPTQALRGDGTIDATRCISDLTQRQDGIPRDLRPLVGDWVWGCDLCQEVCPPTGLAAGKTPAEFAAAEPGKAFPDLQQLLRLRSSGFKRDYRKTAMGWRGPAVLRRNAAVALGNGLDRSTVPALAAALATDPVPMVRAHAAWALGRIASPSALAALGGAAVAEPNVEVRLEISAALKPFADSAR